MNQRPRVMADTEGMELELRPRRSPFETGSSRASLATPSCCCCCCCLNTIGAASGMVGADLKNRAQDGGRSTGASRLFGLLGFLFVPALVVGAAVLLDQADRQSRVIVDERPNPIFDNLWVFGGLLAFCSLLIFVVVHTALRAAAHRESVSLRDLKSSIAIGLFLEVGVVLEVFVALITAFLALLLSPLSTWLGWRTVRERHVHGPDLPPPAPHPIADRPSA